MEKANEPSATNKWYPTAVYLSKRTVKTVQGVPVTLEIHPPVKQRCRSQIVRPPETCYALVYTPIAPCVPQFWVRRVSCPRGRSNATAGSQGWCLIARAPHLHARRPISRPNAWTFEKCLVCFAELEQDFPTTMSGNIREVQPLLRK